MEEQEKERWERCLDLCKDANQQMKNKWFTASDVHSYLRHLPAYESLCSYCPEEYKYVLITVTNLYKYAKQMFGFTPIEIEEAGVHHCESSYLEALITNNQSFIGAICGDIIGSIYEFNSTKDINFKLITPKSKFTDDTVMTCAIAEWLMEDFKHTHNGLVKIMRQYGRKYPNVSYGNMFKIWLNSRYIKPYNSFGNGSAMRVSPIGFYAESLEEALDLAKISAEVTHNHPEGIKGAQAVAAAIYMMKAASINENIDIGLQEVNKFLKEQYSYKLEYTKQEWEKHVKNYTFDETCQGSVPEAIYCALNSNSYEQAVRRTVALGGDADTQAAIAGGISAAFCPVPLNIISECLKLLPEDLKETVSNFNYHIAHKEKLKK